MRDIFFRLWDRKDKVFWMPRYGGFGFDAYYHPKKSGRKSLSALMGVNSENYEGEKRFIAQQYTGLLDKNAKAIFEGDIVEIYSNYNASILFEDGQFRASNHDYCLKHYVKNTEIIGNIFENPKLLD